MRTTETSTAAAPALAPTSAEERDALPNGALLTAEEIPDKLYFRIGDVAKLAGIKPYVLRFWETEFPSLGPKKSGTGHRLYRRKDVQLVFDIKQLLYEKRFTIEGARKHLEARAKTEPIVAASGKRAKATAKKPAKAQAGLFDVPSSALDSVRKELKEILHLLR
jgi:DNA-binding transcriptional MerR regulator